MVRRGEAEMGEDLAVVSLLRAMAGFANAATTLVDAVADCLGPFGDWAGWEAANLYVLDHDRHVLVPTSVGHGAGSTASERLRAAVATVAVEHGTGPVGEAWARGSPIWAQRDSRLGPALGTGTDRAALGVFALPVTCENEVVAVLECFGPAPAAPGPTLLAVASELAGLLGHVAERERSAQRLHRQLHDRAAALERANLDLVEFASVAAHDLRAPLQIMIGFADLLATRYRDRLDDEALDWLRRIQASGQRGAELIADLLAYANVGTGQVAVGPVALEAVAHEVADDLRLIHADAVEIVVHPLPIVAGEKGQLRQLLGNLMGNGTKFVAPGTAPRVVVDAGPGTGPGDVVIRVTDNGIGIPASERDRVFRMFQRLHPRTDYDGSGVGLAICKRIVDRHGGTIWIDAAAGGGTRVCLNLALADQSPPRP
ncbi:MAG: ATP-binding protein [Acidimicrobiia bacterium]